MKCVHCGADVSPGTQMCPTCGRLLVGTNLSFQEGEQAYHSLRIRFSNRLITYQYFVQEVQKIRVRDDQGSIWSIDISTGRWYRLDGGRRTKSTRGRKPDHRPNRWTINKPKWIIGLGIIGAGLILAIGLVLLLLVGYQQVLVSPKIYTYSVDSPSATPKYTLSDDQRKIIEASGKPESFSLFFYDEAAPDDAYRSRRQETWTYYTTGMEYTFLDGSLTHQQSIDYIPVDLQAVPYLPENFVAGMTVNDILATGNLEQYLEVPLENELLPGGKLYYAEQLTFGFRDDQLLYLEALALERGQP